jgi:hypothetical protein
MRSASSAGSGKFASFVDALLFHAVKAPNSPAIGMESGVLTFGQLSDAIFAATGRCEKAGLRPGSLVGLIIADPVWHICLIAALYRLGVPSVSIVADDAGLFPGSDLTTVLHDGTPPNSYSGRLIPVEPDWFSHRSGHGRGPDVAFGAMDLCRVALPCPQARPEHRSPSRSARKSSGTG